MSEAAEYARYARNCLNLSKIYQAPSHRALLVEMADAWLALARDAGALDPQADEADHIAPAAKPAPLC